MKDHPPHRINDLERGCTPCTLPVSTKKLKLVIYGLAVDHLKLLVVVHLGRKTVNVWSESVGNYSSGLPYFICRVSSGLNDPWGLIIIQSPNRRPVRVRVAVEYASQLSELVPHDSNFGNNFLRKNIQIRPTFLDLWRLFDRKLRPVVCVIIFNWRERCRGLHISGAVDDLLAREFKFHVKRKLTSNQLLLVDLAVEPRLRRRAPVSNARRNNGKASSHECLPALQIVKAHRSPQAQPRDDQDDQHDAYGAQHSRESICEHAERLSVPRAHVERVTA
jgi:hypothetical protein